MRAIDPVAWREAGEADWAEEFLALVLAVRVVDSAEEAIEHVNAYGSGHSEAIVTRDTASARAFQLGVDAACVYVNASTRFTDGGEFGMGAEIGNSTQKLHARGPIGARELCTFKYLVEGDGQIRRAAWPGSGCSAGRSTRRTSATWSARRRRASQLGLDRVLLVPVHTPPHKEAVDDPGVERARGAVRGRGGRRRAARRLARGGRRPGALVHGRYPQQAP